MTTAQVVLLRALQAVITDVERAIAQRVASHPRARLLERLPGVGVINLAQLLAEVGPILDRVDNAQQAATECGAPPVTKASGKTTGVYFRWAATRALAKPSHPSPTTPDSSRPGPAPSTPMPEHAESATRMPPASSREPGSASSGPAGTPELPTTPSSTKPVYILVGPTGRR